MRESLTPDGATIILGSENVQDIRVNSEGFDMRNVGNVYHSTLKRRAYAADRDPSHSTAKELLRLINDERQELARLRKDEIDYKDRQDYIAKSERRKKINALYLQLGMAQMLTLGDWSVSRDVEIPVSMGVAPFAEIESMLLNFHYENGLIVNTAPIKEGKLVHLDLGCGNGVVGNRLRRNESIYPFNNGRVLLNYWAEVGYADFMYWTLNDFLRAFVKDEYCDDPALNEFIDVVSTLLMRRIHFGTQFGVKSSKENETLLKLPTNPNVILEVLFHLGAHIKNLKSLKTIKADGEFLLDTDRPISEACQAIIREFYGVGDLTKFENREFGFRSKRPDAFLKRYFRPELYRVNPDLEEDLKQINAELNSTSLVLKQCILKLKALNPHDPDCAVERKLAIAAKNECNRCCRDLERSRSELLAQKTDLSAFITIYPHNVVLGDFEEFGDLFPEKPTFDFVHSFRATSHAQNFLYAAITGQVAHRLKPGGIVIEDGKRESYTREERIDALIGLQKELGSEYRIGVVANEEGTKSVLMQRAITKPDGTMMFFFDRYGDQLIQKGHAYCPIEEFSARWPEIIFRNSIIQRLKELYIDQSLEGATPEEVPARIWNGRMQFRGLYVKVTDALEKNVFSTPEWQGEIRDVESTNFKYQATLQNAWGLIILEIEEVRRRFNIVTAGAAPIKTKDFGTVSLRPAIIEDASYTHYTQGIYKQRHTSIEDMPRNMNVPDFAALESERVQLFILLHELRDKTGKPALSLVEFDNCFTNPLLRRMLCVLLGEEGMKDLVTVENVKLRSGKYPLQRDGCIYIIGGSLNDAYDPFGQTFTENFSRPLVERIQKDEAVRAIGICFGHQSLLEAYGALHGLPFETKRGSLEFGVFPVRFGDSHACLKHLRGQTCTTSMTRSGYTLVPGYQNVLDMKPLAYECSGLIKPGKMGLDLEVPPVSFALEQGRIVTCQFHPDVWTSHPHDRGVLRTYLARNHQPIQRVFSRPVLSIPRPDTTQKIGTGSIKVIPPGLNSPAYIFNHNVALDANDKTGKRTPWVVREVGPAFLIPTLTHLSSSLLQSLRAKN